VHLFLLTFPLIRKDYPVKRILWFLAPCVLGLACCIAFAQQPRQRNQNPIRNPRVSNYTLYSGGKAVRKWVGTTHLDSPANFTAADGTQVAVYPGGLVEER